MSLARTLQVARASLLAATMVLPLAATSLVAQEAVDSPSSVSARELQSAIDAIKRRVAEQQSARETGSENALEVELESARQTIAELTHSLERLRGERDALKREIEASQNDKSALVADLAALRDTEAGLRAALETSKGEAAAAEKELTASREQAAVGLAERDRQLNELRQAMDAEATARAGFEEKLTAMEAERSGLTTDLAAAVQDVARLEGELAEAKSAAERLTADLAAEREHSAAAETKLAEREAAERGSRTEVATLKSEIAELRELASRSVDEIEQLGETLLATMAENAELATALVEARETRTVLEAELKAVRLELEAGATSVAGAQDGLAMPPTLASSDATSEARDAELAAAKQEIATLTEELIARDKQLAEGAASGDVDALIQQMGLLQREVETLGTANAALSAELAELRGSAPSAPEIVNASADPAQSLDRFLTELNAVDTGDGWWMTVPEGLVFAPGSDALAAGTEPTVTQLATLIRYFDDAPVRIVGHTDSFGDAEVNRNLSVKRAESVGRALVEEHGIDAARISTEGFGEEQPVASNATIEGRRANRRVEIYIRR